MSIHTFGDSHSVNGWGSNVYKHHLGPLLAYNFGAEKLNRFDIRNFDIKDGDNIIFCLGEIDCRCHVHKHITETNSYHYIIDTIVNNYFEAIKLNVMISQIQLKNICVYNVIPPRENPNYYDLHSNIPFAHVGNCEERKKYTLYFNEKLKEKCIENNYIFFDIYDKYTDLNGFLNLSLSDGTVHIKEDSVYINDFIVDNL
jgi:hypothetical protein